MMIAAEDLWGWNIDRNEAEDKLYKQPTDNKEAGEEWLTDNTSEEEADTEEEDSEDECTNELEED